MHLRAEMAAGRGEVAIDDGKFSLADYRGFLADNDDEHRRVPCSSRPSRSPPSDGRGTWPASSAARPKGLFTFVWHAVHRPLTIDGRHRRDTACTMAKSSDQANSGYLEVERKFEVVESTVSPVVRGAVVGGAGGAFAVAAARCRLLRHAGPRSRRPPRHVAPPHRWHRRRLAPQIAGRAGRQDRGASAARRRERRRRVPDDLLDVVLAIVRDRPVSPVARISTSRTVDVLLRTRRRPQWQSSATTDGRPRRPARTTRVRAAVARVGAGTGRGRRPRPAGPADEPAARRGRGAGRPRFETRARPGGVPTSTNRKRSTTPADPVHRAVAEQVEQLLVWDRAVRADVVRLGAPDAGDDAQDPQPVAGVGGCVRHLRRRVDPRRVAAVGGGSGVARDAEVLAERYEQALDELPGGAGARAGAGAAGRGRQEALQVRPAAVADRDAVAALLPAARRAGGPGGRRAAADAAG